jgi:hypothetical protein
LGVIARRSCLRDLHAQFGCSSPSNVTHHHGGGNGFSVHDSPDAAIAHFSNGDADASYVYLHHVGIRRRHFLRKRFLGLYRIRAGHVQLQIRHAELLKQSGRRP